MGVETIPGIPERTFLIVLAVEGLIIIAVGGGVLTLVNVASGWRQRREGGGTLSRLLGVSLAFTLLEGVPIVLAVVGHFASDEAPGDATLFVAGLVCFMNFVVLRLFLQPHRTGTEPPELVRDATLLARVGEISQNMGIAAPPVRLRRTLGGVAAAQGRVEGLVVPTLIVTDGILDRLTAPERDAILAHELAHIANGSLWLLALMSASAASLAVGFAWFVPGWVTIGLWIAIYVGLIRIASRFIEIDCDSRAGRAVGYAEMASALRKIHAIHSFRGASWRKHLRFAMATHPHLETRMAALNRAAEKAGRGSIPYWADVVRRQGQLSVAALFTWLGVVILTLCVAWRAELSYWIPCFLVAAYAASRFFGTPERRRLLKINRRRMGTGHMARLGAILPPLLIGSIWILLHSDWLRDPLLQIVAPLGLVAFSIVVLFLSHSRRHDTELLGETREELAARNFPRVLELARQNRKRVSRNPRLRHNVALATAMSGDRTGAIAQLEKLRAESPRFKMASFLLISLYLAQDERRRAFEIAREIATELPLDPGAHYLLARAARRVGDLKQAQEAIDRTRALEAGGEATALAAGVAADAGDFDRARELIQSAHTHAPGGAHVLIEEANLLIRTKSADVVHEAVRKAIEVARANPFALLDYEIKQLESARDSIAEVQVLANRPES
jgi:Zn-dependent protease with chaperone function/Flp pilus assembly protein TadD